MYFSPSSLSIFSAKNNSVRYTRIHEDVVSRPYTIVVINVSIFPLVKVLCVTASSSCETPKMKHINLCAVHINRRIKYQNPLITI